MKTIVIPTSVFDPCSVPADSQEEYAALIAASGGQGIEFRRELFRDGELPLEKCRRAVERYRLFCVYSAPVELWLEDGTLNESGLAMVMEEAEAIQADLVKLPLGRYEASRSDVGALSGYLVAGGRGGKAVRLCVENDQTEYGGRLQPLLDFFKAVTNSRAPVGMTFDTGNWAYCGENVFAAAELLRKHVVYIHCKHVEQIGRKMKTIAIGPEPDAAWRALLRLLPPDVPRAIEFRLPDVSALPGFISLLKEA